MESYAARWAAAALLCLLPACGGAEMAAKDAESPPQPMVAAAPAADPEGESAGLKREEISDGKDRRLADNTAPLPPPPPGGAPPGKQSPAQPGPPQQRPDVGEVAVMRAPMLIYTAQITLAVFEVNISLGKVEAIGRDLGGFLAKRDDRSITIRVPAARFDEAVKRVEDVGDMLHRNVAAQDVTEEFRDLEIRLKSARAVQQRLTELLAKAVKVEESIAIERELDRVSGEIERVEGKLKFLRDRAAFSTITVVFDAKPREQVGGQPIRLPVDWLYDLGLKRLLAL
jgi:hypothetical protein